LKKLTKRQREMLDYIKEYIEDHRYSPSVRDIAAHFSLASAGGVHKHLKNLEQKGYISTGKKISRSIRVLEENQVPVLPFGIRGAQTDMRLVELPLRGRVAAGAPIDYRLDNEFIPFPASMVKQPEKTYVLQVRGNSMIEDCICDGDYVLVENRNTADNGEMVIAMLNYQEATLKKVFFEGKQVRLQPANYTMEPIYVSAEDLTIQGVVVGILRKY